MVKASLTNIALHELFCYIGVGTLTCLKCYFTDFADFSNIQKNQLKNNFFLFFLNDIICPPLDLEPNLDSTKL